MKIQPLNNINFLAKIKREKLYDTKTCNVISNPTMEDVLKEYDDAINNIQMQKQKAINLDVFMRSDDVKELTDDLPQDDLIVINERYGDGIRPMEYTLEYRPNDNTGIDAMRSSDVSRFCRAYKTADSSFLEEDKIIDWLKKLSIILKR